MDTDFVCLLSPKCCTDLLEGLCRKKDYVNKNIAQKSLEQTSKQTDRGETITSFTNLIRNAY